MVQNESEKTAQKAGLFRRALRPALFGAGGAGLGAGGFAVGKGSGKEEQLAEDQKVFNEFAGAVENYLKQDVVRDRQREEEAFMVGMQHGMQRGRASQGK